MNAKPDGPLLFSSPPDSSPDYFTFLPKTFLLLPMTSRIQYNLLPEPIKLYSSWPRPTFPASFLTARLTRPQLLTVLPLPQMLSLVPALLQAVHTRGPLSLERVLSYFHVPNCFAYFGADNLFKDNFPITIPKILLPVILSLITATHLYFFITVKAIGNVLMFNICLLVSTLSSLCRKANPGLGLYLFT